MPLPPLPDQHRIVDLLSRAEGIVRLRREAEKKAAELIPALFLDMFGDPTTNPKRWPVTAIGEVASYTRYGPRFPDREYGENGAHILRTTDMGYAGELRWSKAPILPVTADELVRFSLKQGTLLVTRTGATIGKIALFSGASEPCIAGAYLIELGLKPDVVPEYVLWHLLSGFGQAHLIGGSRAVAQPNLNAPTIRAIPLPLPPAFLQRKFAEKLAAVQSIQSQQSGAITAVSAVSLWFKSGNYAKAEQLAYLMLSAGNLPDFASFELRTLVQAIWTESSKQQAGVSFLPGQVYVAVRGGEVVTGGAPLDLIVDKVQTIQSMFYRTIEEVKKMPLRTRGAPIREIQEAGRPWLFQAPPGSYQFSVAIQEPVQKDFFEGIDPSEIAERFLDILRAASSDDPSHLENLVPDEGYRSTYLKLTRNLAPSGKTFENLEIRSAADSMPVALSPDSRRMINSALRAKTQYPKPEAEETEKTLNGTLRAVDLDKDYIDVSVDGQSEHIVGLKDALDDVIGPMVNRRVMVRVLQRHGESSRFVDIELDE